jgi:hypothetical protein
MPNDMMKLKMAMDKKLKVNMKLKEKFFDTWDWKVHELLSISQCIKEYYVKKENGDAYCVPNWSFLVKKLLHVAETIEKQNKKRLT